MESVQVLKLTTGQDIISETEIKDGVFRLKNPMTLMLSEKGTYIMFPGFLPLAKRDANDDCVLDISSEHVICNSEVDERTKKIYAEQFSKVVTPEKPSLIVPK